MMKANGRVMTDENSVIASSSEFIKGDVYQMSTYVKLVLAD